LPAPAVWRARDNRARMLRRAAAPLVLVLFLLAGCGGSDGDEPAEPPKGEQPAATTVKLIRKNPANASTTLTIGSKNFTEEFILGEIYAQALEAGGYRVRRRLDYGPELIAFKGVREGKIDAYPEYTGTALTTFFDVEPDAIPKDEQEAYEQAKAGFAKRGVTALPPTPFTDSNAVGMTQARAAELGVQTISDLKRRARSLTLSGSPECRRRLDCKLGLERVYGLKFKKYLPTMLEDRHKVLTGGKADVSIVFSTDGQIAADDLLVLEDDKRLFPPYNVSLVVNDKAARAAGPDLPKIVAQVQQDLSTKVMQELNSRVDLDGEKPAEVARAYLQQFGYTE
jgi:glycine betaine/choline ABC-type transport system substrate-binding protein